MIIPIVYLIFFLILFIILLKITKILWKAILFTLILFLLITSLTAYLVYKDVNNIINEDKTFLLVNNQTVLAGGLITGKFEEIIYVNDSELENYSVLYSSKDYKSILGKNYLLIILKTRSLEELNLTITTPENIIQSDDLVKLLEIENKEEFLKQAEELNLTYIDQASQDILNTKLAITKDILQATLKDDVSKLKDVVKEVEFYPDRLSIMIAKQMPLKVILSFIIKETINGG
ncbi:hypothetical protein J4438_03280 [Candidatus Woesearchaeota archaeon]|nr:hypothetical protein [Candidatus Woesearchaeota archaeon]